jgi:two-component system sensor histidine kinase DegS
MMCLKGGLKKSEVRFTTKDGKQKWFEVSCQPLQSPESQGTNVLLAVDTTEASILKDAMQSYITHVAQLREIEHERLAHKLHEEILQSLAALNMAIESVIMSGKPTQEHLNPELIELQKKIADAINDIRNISYELKSGLLDYLGLVKALETMVDEINTEKHFQASFSLTGNERKLPTNVEATLYLIAQEALKNSGRHSKATRIQVRLHFGLSKVRLTITDNGKGFDVPTKLMSFANLGKIGLVNMENWTLLLNGILQIHSKINKGTKISVEVKI